MGEIIERKCRCCGYVYKYEKYPSYISFCPRCKSHDYTVCHYTKKGITQCMIYLGGKVIGKVISQKNKNYRLSYEMFEINEELIDSFNPYFEAEKIVQKRFREYYGHLDLKNGRLFLSDEILEKYYTEKQFRKSELYQKFENKSNIWKIDLWAFQVMLEFNSGYLHQIRLKCLESNCYYNDEKEYRKFYDSIFMENDWFDKEEFDWGYIESMYDEDDTNIINIVFHYTKYELPLFYNSELLHKKLNFEPQIYEKTNFGDQVCNELTSDLNETGDVEESDDIEESEDIEESDDLEESDDVEETDDIEESNDEKRNAETPLKEYLTMLLKENDILYYDILNGNPDVLYTFKEEYYHFIRTLNCKNDRNEEVERFFMFLHNKELTISKLVAKKQGKEYLYSQLLCALELEDKYFNYYLLPGFNEQIYNNLKVDQMEIALCDYTRINSLTGELVDLNYFMSYFVRQWDIFIKYLYETIDQISNNTCVKMSLMDAVNIEKERLKRFRENFYNSDKCYDGKNDNLYKSLYLYCLMSYLDDFYLSKFPDISNETILDEYSDVLDTNIKSTYKNDHMNVYTDINAGLDMSGYNMKDIPSCQEKEILDFTALRNVIPQRKYSLKKVAEVYALALHDDEKKVYKRLEKFFSSTGAFRPSEKSGEYEFNDVILTIAFHLYFKKKNRKFNLDDKDLLSDTKVFYKVYYPLFKAKVFGKDEIIEAYSDYRSIILKEFKKCLVKVDDGYLNEAINYIIGKSSMRLNLQVIGTEESLIDLI